MPQHRLSDRTVKAAKVGRHPDGGGLYLQVTASKEEGQLSRSWLFRFATGEIKTSKENGKRYKAGQWMGLGSYPDVSLAEARDKAADARKLRKQGIDPIKARDDEQKAAAAAAAMAVAKEMTFDQCRGAYLAVHRKGWRSAKHAKLWERSLVMYVTPVFGALPVAVIDTALVMKALEPIWPIVPDVAVRVRGRIEQVLDWAKVRGYRGGENPARWRGHLDKLLPARSKLRAVTHHKALPYIEVPAFIRELRERPATASRSLEFVIATVARTGEAVGARWSEIDLDAKTWLIPGSRMKGGIEHRVPLSPAAIDVLKQMLKIRENDFVFPGGRGRERLSVMAMDMLLRRMHRDITVHGFRSAFRDWAGEQTNFPREVIELCLAHMVGSKVEQAYFRSDLFEKRRKLMDTWARYCTAAPIRSAKVLQFRESA
jgi:integrase